MPDFKLFDKAKIQIVLKHPFFARLLMAMPIREVDTLVGHNGVQTYACTNGLELFLNTSMCKELTEAQKQGLLCHEVMHPALGHLWRKNGRDALKWNEACDYVINILVRDAGLDLPRGCLEDETYRDMSSEEVYNILLQKNKKYDKSFDKFVDLSFKAMEVGGDLLDGDSSNNGLQGTLRGFTQSDIEEMKETWKQALSDATVIAKTQGKLPGSFKDVIDNILNGELPWQTLLANLASEISKDDYSINYPDRRFLETDFYMPDLYSDTCKIGVLLDTSGSRDLKEMQSGLSELHGILNAGNVKKLRYMTCDTEVTLDTWLDPTDELPKVLRGRGGTDFRSAFNRFTNPVNEEGIDALIVSTDGYVNLDNIKKPSFPVIWLLDELPGKNYKDDHFLWGTVIHKK